MNEQETIPDETTSDLKLTPQECQTVLQCMDSALKQGVNGLAGASALISLADKLATSIKQSDKAPE